MYIVMNTLHYDASKIHLFVLRNSAFDYLKSLEYPNQHVVIEVNLKVINDLTTFVKNMFKVERRVIEPELVAEPAPIQEPVKTKRKYVKKSK